MPSKTTNTDKMAAFHAARAKEERRMEALGKRIARAGERAKLSAYYHGDGAYQSADRCMKEAHHLMTLAQQYIRNKGWQVKGGPR